MNVVILGAGASKSYSVSPTKCRMPIAVDFFPTFNQLSISSNPWVFVGAILNIAEREFGITSSDFVNAKVDIEDFHSRVQARLLDLIREGEFARAAPYWKAHCELVFLFASVLNEIQNGPPSETHRALARLLGDEDVVVTFNWDTLMDRALAMEKQWQVDEGYTFTPASIFRNEWVTPSSPGGSSAARIIKLHGSSNWLTSAHIFGENMTESSIQTTPPETVYVYEQANAPYNTYRGRFMNGYEPFSYGYYPPNILDDPGISPGKDRLFVRMKMNYPWVPPGTSGDAGIESMPLIIPPVKQKAYDQFGGLFAELWNRAETALVNADRIVVIGYSFPKTDIRSNQLFQNAMMRRDTIPRVVILDPSPDLVQQRFHHDYGIPASSITVFKEYWSETWQHERLFQ